MQKSLFEKHQQGKGREINIKDITTYDNFEFNIQDQHNMVLCIFTHFSNFRSKCWKYKDSTILSFYVEFQPFQSKLNFE